MGNGLSGPETEEVAMVPETGPSQTHERPPIDGRPQRGFRWLTENGVSNRIGPNPTDGDEYRLTTRKHPHTDMGRGRPVRIPSRCPLARVS
jgi:hypothetical protein